MRYFVKEKVTDEMLKDLGFVITDNCYGKKGFDDCFEAVLKIDEQYDIVLQDREKPLAIGLYDKTIIDDDPYIFDDITPYIQDLIDAGLVEVRE